MVDNFLQIKNFLSFDSEDDFYFVQLIQRKKNNVNIKGTNNKNRIIRSYYIQSVEYLENVEDEIKKLSNYFHARAGINLNKRSFMETGFHLLKETADQIYNGNYKNLKHSYNTVCGRYKKSSEKKWIVDVDTQNSEKLVFVKNVINNCRPSGNKIISRIPTKSGYHIISHPFDVKEFKQSCSEDIHKNNPTALYYPD